jgi:hypothetical protein
MKPYDFKWTKFYESNSEFLYTGIQLDLAENELIICSTIIDKDNFSILTTRRLLTNQSGLLSSENIQGATDKLYGDFKGYKNKNITFGQVQLQSGNELKYFIETGKASMIMIHGVRTLIGTTQMTNKQVDNVTRIWNEQNEK